MGIQGGELGSCQLCGKDGKQVARAHGMLVCSYCAGMASMVKGHRAVVDTLYEKFHGVAHGAAAVGPADCDYYLEIIADVRDALPGKPSAGELAGAVRELVRRSAGAEAVAVPADGQLGCDPHACDELRDALALILRIRHKLDNAGLAEIMLHAGRPCPDDIEELLSEAITELHDLDADRHNIEVRVERLRAALGMLRVPGRDPEHPSPWRRDICANIDELIAALDSRGPEDSYQVPSGYESLMQVLVAAHHQAAFGKGCERHGTSEPFERQPSCQDARLLGLAFPIGQARKKALEATRLQGSARRRELLGAIVYLAIAHIVDSEASRMYAAPEDGLEIAYSEGGGHD